MTLYTFFSFWFLCLASFSRGANIIADLRDSFAPSKSLTKALFPEQPELPVELNSTKCGDVLVAKGGFISYKHETNYNNNERCIWTIRTHKWQTSFLMHGSGFASLNDHLAVYVVNENGFMEQKAQIDTSTGNRIIGVIGPVVFLVLTTDQIGTGKGFLIEYFGFGYNELSGYVYEHSYLESSSGSISWPQKPVDHHINIFSTFTIAPQIPNENLALTTTIDKVDLISLVRGCHHNYFSVHQLFQDGFIVRLRYCEADLLTLAKISSSSPLLITYASTMGPRQTGISFTWNEEQKQK